MLDASIYIFRYYFSLPDHWFSPQNYPTGAVYGYTTFLLNFLQSQRPQMMAACFDESLGSCFRNQLYPAYKCSRVLPDEALAFQLQACREVTGLLGITSFASETYEADDLLGSLLTGLVAAGDRRAVAILTRDKDLGQLLLRPQDCLWDYASAQSQQRFYRSDIFHKFGVWPEQLPDYLALVGDSADDIPGVPGIGAKTARALLEWQPSLEAMFARLDELPSLPLRGARGLPDKLLEGSEQIVLSRCLASIVTDIDWAAEGVTDLDLRWQPQYLDAQAFADFCLRMGFGRGLLNKFNQLQTAVGNAPQQPPAQETVTLL